ncbi:LysR family transcriptional regulator [Paraburkholderia sp. 32]|uniref:LysR family transcriptional regulator n=1 Tax=Paraburkholderia sp. 32 TaxID=2991057 RepID=UPI003D1ED90A
MEVRQLMHFIAIAETGSFTKASERVCLSQPALSASITKLEADLEAQLFIRNRTRVSLTTAGQRLLQEAKTIVNSVSGLKNSVQHGPTSIALRIGIHWTIPSRYIARLMKQFQDRHPEIAVTLTDGNREDLITQLRSGTLHGLILGEDSSVTVPTFNPLFQDRFVVATPQGHPFSSQGAVAVSALSEQPLILCRSCEKYPAILKTFADRDIKPRYIYTTDQVEGALNLVSAGVGIALAPKTFSAPGIAMIALQDFDITRTVGLQWTSSQSHEHLEIFLGAAREYDWTERNSAAFDSPKTRVESVAA